MEASEVEIAVSTCDRSPQYVHQTLARMVATSVCDVRKVRLVVCGPSAAYVEGWREEIGAELEPWSSEDAALVAPTPQGRTGQNFIRQLRGEGPLIALQDDLDFAEDWLRKALETATSIERAHPRFVLALYAPYKLRSIGGTAAPYNPLRFYGNQALLMSAITRRELLTFCEAAETGPDDMMLKAFLSQSRARLFARNPNVIQHVGQASSVEQRFHRSPTFRAW